jgi:ABC-type transport system involved in multi-copper enzyme maturation permease subunit
MTPAKRFDILFGIAVAAVIAGILALLHAPPVTLILAVGIGGIVAWNPVWKRRSPTGRQR